MAIGVAKLVGFTGDGVVVCYIKHMHLLLVPGRGDKYAMFRQLAKLWRHLGFDARMWEFDWQRDDGDFAGRFDELLRHIDSLPERVCIIGASAGGTVAVNALLTRPSKVVRVATISAPLARDFGRNTVLSRSFAHMQSALERAQYLLGRVCTTAGYRDNVVPPVYSKLPGSLARRVPGWSHNSSIVLALTLYALPIARWLKRASAPEM